jgi:hypothetical protein
MVRNAFGVEEKSRMCNPLLSRTPKGLRITALGWRVRAYPGQRGGKSDNLKLLALRLGAGAHREQTVRLRNPLERMLTTILEGRTGGGPRQVAHGLRDESLARRRRGGDADVANLGLHGRTI